MTRRIVVLTEGHSDPVTAKTAASLLRYRPEEVIAVFDTTNAGRTAEELFGVGGLTPVIGKLADADRPTELALGVAPSGGRIPEDWREVILEAIRSRMNIISGMHQFLNDDAEFVAAATDCDVELIDVRRNNERDVANREGLSDECLRVLTVGNDCCVGKMVTSIELTNALKAQGHNAKFVATGQTGIMIEGDGCPVDCVVSDFVNGAAEKLVLANQHHDIMLIEGQGSLAHPRYSAVTLGLLHGSSPHGMILCYEAGREAHHHMTQIPLRPLDEMLKVYELMAGLMSPARVIGIAMNSRKLSDTAADEERNRVSQQLGLPVADVIRHGTAELVDAILKLKSEINP